MSDSTEKRVLSINPDLFKISKNNNTRKNRPPTEKPAKIKIRDPMKTHIGNSRKLKRNLLNYIRKQQEIKSKSMLQDKEQSNRHIPAIKPTDDILDKEENSHFKDSLDFLKNLTNEKEKREKMEKTHNQTLKRHESMNKFGDFNSVENGMSNAALRSSAELDTRFDARTGKAGSESNEKDDGPVVESIKNKRVTMKLVPKMEKGRVGQIRGSSRNTRKNMEIDR